MKYWKELVLLNVMTLLDPRLIGCARMRFLWDHSQGQKEIRRIRKTPDLLQHPVEVANHSEDLVPQRNQLHQDVSKRT